MLSVRVNAIKAHSVSEDGMEVTVALNAKHVGDLSLLMSAERCEELLSVLSSIKSAIQVRRPKKNEQVSVTVPKNWLVSADVQVHGVVVLVFNHQANGQTGYALDANSAKQLAVGLVKNAEAVLTHKAAKDK